MWIDIKNAVCFVGFTALGAADAADCWLKHCGSFSVGAEAGRAVGVTEVSAQWMRGDRHGGTAYGGGNLAEAAIASEEDVALRQSCGHLGQCERRSDAGFRKTPEDFIFCRASFLRW